MARSERDARESLRSSEKELTLKGNKSTQQVCSFVVLSIRTAMFQFNNKSVAQVATHVLLLLSTYWCVFQFNNKSVAQVATHMLLLLCDHIPLFLEKDAEIPCKIIEV